MWEKILNPTKVEILENFQMTSQISIPTCYKSHQGSCIELMPSNSKLVLSKCDAVETGVNNLHQMIFGFLKYKSIKLPPKEITYRSYKQFIRIFLTNNSTTIFIWKYKLLWEVWKYGCKAYDTLRNFVTKFRYVEKTFRWYQ